MCIGNVEHVTVSGGQCAACHAETGGSDLGITGHGLVDHDVVHVFLGTAALGIAHVTGHITIFQCDGILSFDDQCLGIIGGQCSIFYRNIRGRINCRGIIAVALIGSVVDHYSTAATVGTNGCGRIAGSFYRQVRCIGSTASGGLDTAGIICRGGDGGIGNVHHCTFAIAEYAVAVLGGGCHRSTGNGNIGTVGCQECRIHAVEIAVLGIGGGTGSLIYSNICQSHLCTVHAKGIFIIPGGCIGLCGISTVCINGDGCGSLRHFSGSAETSGCTIAAGSVLCSLTSLGGLSHLTAGSVLSSLISRSALPVLRRLSIGLVRVVCIPCLRGNFRGVCGSAGVRSAGADCQCHDHK